jgi:hypothetical protein
MKYASNVVAYAASRPPALSGVRALQKYQRLTDFEFGIN